MRFLFLFLKFTGGFGLDNKLQKVKRVLWIVLILNLVVAALKCITGYLIRSNSMLADGFHSMADGSSNIIGLVGITAALKPVDKDHPYGHKKFETFAALGIAALLLLAIVSILHEAYGRILHPVIPKINLVSFVVMFLTLAVNIWIVRYEKKMGTTFNSDILISDAHHTNSDIYVSLSVIASLVATKLGINWFDTVASLVIAGLIARAGYEIVKHSSSVLCDKAVLDETKIVELALSIDGVIGCHKVRSRGRTDDLQIDLHIEVNPEIVVEQAHKISHQVAEAVGHEIEGVSDVMVHIEPVGDEQET
jgi:cation diffusion facilitator family transporter